MSKKWKDFRVSLPKEEGWKDCSKCNGSGCNPNRTNVCWYCKGTGGRYTKIKDGLEVVSIPADAEVFPIESIFKDNKKGDSRYARQQYRFKKYDI